MHSDTKPSTAMSAVSWQNEFSNEWEIQADIIYAKNRCNFCIDYQVGGAGMSAVGYLLQVEEKVFKAHWNALLRVQGHIYCAKECTGFPFCYFHASRLLNGLSVPSTSAVTKGHFWLLVYRGPFGWNWVSFPVGSQRVTQLGAV